MIKIFARLEPRIRKITLDLIEKSPVCYKCHGSGFTNHIQRIDSITTQDNYVSCTLCDQYGHYPMGWFTRFMIKLYAKYQEK